MTNPARPGRPAQILVHHFNTVFGEAVVESLRQRDHGRRVLFAPDCHHAARALAAAPVDFCVFDLDDPAGADLFFDLLTVSPTTGVLLTSARLPGERPALPPDHEVRVLLLDHAATPAVLGETLCELFGLDAAVAAPARKTPDAAGGIVPPQTRRLSGNLQILLPDLVQLKCLTGRSCVLEISAGPEAGRIFFKEGNIVHASTGRLEGFAALLAIFGWKDSRFVEHRWSEPTAQTIHQRWEAVLLELSRMTDEAGQRPPEPTLEISPVPEERLRAA